MTTEQAERPWEFTDDRGTTVTAGRRPRRVLAYVRAGAGLWEYGLRPVGVYGSAHDSGTEVDPVKAGALDSAEVPYLGSGSDLGEDTLSELRPDLVVDVTYDGEHAYAVGKPLLAEAEAAGVPVVVLSVAGGSSLTGILGRFGELATALGGSAGGAAAELAAVEEELRAAAAVRAPRALVLSGAGTEQVHVARPEAWPELRHLTGLGVDLADPGPGPGANWLTTDWAHAVELGRGADLVLADSRAHASGPEALAELPAWRELTADAAVVPWNPELPPAPAACADFLRAVAAALPGTR